MEFSSARSADETNYDAFMAFAPAAVNLYGAGTLLTGVPSVVRTAARYMSNFLYGIEINAAVTGAARGSPYGATRSSVICRTGTLQESSTSSIAEPPRRLFSSETLTQAVDILSRAYAINFADSSLTAEVRRLIDALLSVNTSKFYQYSRFRLAIGGGATVRCDYNALEHALLSTDEYNELVRVWCVFTVHIARELGLSGQVGPHVAAPLTEDAQYVAFAERFHGVPYSNYPADVFGIYVLYDPNPDRINFLLQFVNVAEMNPRLAQALLAAVICHDCDLKYVPAIFARCGGVKCTNLVKFLAAHVPEMSDRRIEAACGTVGRRTAGKLRTALKTVRALMSGHKQAIAAVIRELPVTEGVHSVQALSSGSLDTLSKLIPAFSFRRSCCIVLCAPVPFSEFYKRTATFLAKH